VADGTTSAEQQVRLLRVPSAVRALLPSKPYQLPQNPLPGAQTEPDCCSICLIELESGEHLTVLPCMHFYHKVCTTAHDLGQSVCNTTGIGSDLWLHQHLTGLSLAVTWQHMVDCRIRWFDIDCIATLLLL